MFFWLSCGAAGLSTYLILWVLTRPVITQNEPAAAYSRQLALKLIWPWVAAFAHLCKPFISWRLRRSLTRSILISGVDRVWQPEHIVALQCLASLLGAAGTVAVMAYSSFGVAQVLFFALMMGGICMWWPRRWLRKLTVARQHAMLMEFPFLLDMTTLCVEAGLNLQGALQQAAQHGPDGPLRQDLRHALADMRAGAPRLDALRDMADRSGMPAVQQLVAALAQADLVGMSLGPLLRAQAEQRRAERFLRAEKLALEAPVKMLFPMVFCIFPCTFLIIGFPIAIKLLGAGL